MPVSKLLCYLPLWQNSKSALLWKRRRQ